MFISKILKNITMERVIIAIDGATGTGKSTTANLLADKLKYNYIDSGAYYRVITYLILKNNLNPTDSNKIIDVAENIRLEFKDQSILLNGEDISKQIKSLEVTNKVSSVSKVKGLRKIINEKIRKSSTDKNVVVEGQDIGTTVFPEAQYKFYLICDIDTRVARRKQDFLDIGQNITKEKILKELKKRDEIDLSRKESPLKKSENAMLIDTANMIVEEQVELLYKKILGLENNK